jgi:N-formylglutamate deformylase
MSAEKAATGLSRRRRFLPQVIANSQVTPLKASKGMVFAAKDCILNVGLRLGLFNRCELNSMDLPFETTWHAAGPLLAIAAHDGHTLRPDASPWILLDDAARLREEDPWTGEWTSLGDRSIVVNHSRFEADVNRPRELALYQCPEDAWGLSVWSPDTPSHVFERSLGFYDDFYNTLRCILDEVTALYGRVVVLDLHTYNHRRAGCDALCDDPSLNPEINLGTGTMDRTRWASLVDRFVHDLRAFPFRGRTLDVRENVRFRGGYIPTWVHTEYPETACALAIEVKKFFMDEWTGVRDVSMHSEIMEALRSTLPGLREELANAEMQNCA